MSEPRTFPTETILSITTGYLLTNDGMAALQECMEYLAGEPIWTHQIPRLVGELRPWLHQQHPSLTGLHVANLSKETWQEWTADAVARVGPTLTVSPIPRGQHTSVNPLTELADMLGPRGGES